MPEKWNENEIKTTVKEYFRLLKLEQSGKSFVKKVIYQKLHEANPRRSLKSYEFKFQNISAVLYEQKLPTKNLCKWLIHSVGPAGLEPATP